jgi:putative Ig domain-containing protein
MKLLRLLTGVLLCAFILAIASANSFALSWAQSYGVGSYDGNGHTYDDPFYGSGFDFPVAMAKMPDGGFVVVGQMDLPKFYNTYTSHTSSRSMSSLVRFGVDGTVLWQYALRQTNDTTQGGVFYPGTSHVYQIATDAQGNVFICGNKGGNGITNNLIVPFVAKFSPDGALLWDNGFSKVTGTVGDPAQPYEVGIGPINYMGLTNDGGVIVTTSQARPNVGYSIPSLAKFNSDGSLAFYKTYDNPAQYLGTSPVCQSKDGSRYVAAMRYTGYGCLLLVTDSAGNLVAQRGYGPSDNPNETPVAIIATSDGGFATLSAINDYAGGILRKFNADLSAEVFEKRIAAASGHNPHVATNSLTETADGGFLISGETYNGPSTYDVMLMKLASDATLQFVSLVGGPLNEGGPVSTGPSTAFAIPLTNGGYGLATTSASYNTGGAIGGGYYYKPDWWIAKTDANRKVRNFNGTMLDEPLSSYTLTGSPQSAANLSDFVPPNYSYGAVTTNQPAFIFEDLAHETSPDLPTLAIQAAGPRILSDHKVEAIVEQHFSYHVVTAYFPPSSQITYSAEGLPPGFILDAQTGIISGIAHVGSETVENDLPPIPITVHATDGTDTADGTIDLAISDGAPAFSVTPASAQANPVLSFTCFHPGKQAGRIMNVEYMAPDQPGLWRWLDNGSNGYMTYDTSSSHYVLNSTGYPQQNGVRFRAKLTVHGRTDLISNEVGPFDLGSGTARSGQPVLSMVRNGIRADFDFYVTELSAPSGVAVRVQSTTTPSAEGTWADLQDTGTGHMTAAAGSNLFTHTSNDVPLANGVYFRAIANASGFVDSISNIIGPYNLIGDTPPQVTLDQPTGASGGDGLSGSTPLIFRADSTGAVNFHFHGEATFPVGSPRSVKNLKILVDGSPIETRDGVATISVDYTTTRLGGRVIELFATDDLGATARAGTGPLYVQIEPFAGTGSRPSRLSKSGTKAATQITGNGYSLAKEGAFWNDPTAWITSFGDHGVPGPNDLALIGNHSVKFNQPVTVGALTLIADGARLIGPGTLTVNQKLTIIGGTAENSMHLIIAPGALCEMQNVNTFVFNGIITNKGIWRTRGVGGLTGLTSFDNQGEGVSDFQMPLLTSSMLANIAPVARVLATQSFTNSGSVLSSLAINATGIVAQGGGNIVAQGGGNLVKAGGGTIVAQGGGNIVAQGGGNIVAQGGGNIVAQGAGNIVAQGGGNVAVKQGSCLIGPDGAGIVAQGGGNIVAQGAGNIVAQGGGNIVAQGGGNIQNRANKLHGPYAPAGAVPAGFVQSDGAVDLNFVMITGAVDVEGGMLSGSGVIDGSLSMNGGVIAPGHSSGQIMVTGDYNQASASTMIVEAGGGEPGQFDQMQVGGHATLAGALQFHTLNGYVPLPEDPFNPFGYNSFSGNFDYASANGQITVNPNGILLELAPTATNPLALTSAVSRKVHGAAGPFDVLLPLTGQPGVECRSSNGQHTLIFFFSNNITSAGASLQSDTGNANGAPIISANTITINLSGIADGRQIAVTLQGVMDEFGQLLPDTVMPMDTLIGDTSGNGAVTGTDVSQTKLKSGAAVNSANFREDINVNGGINGTDVSIVKLHSGMGITTPSRENNVAGRPGK